MLYTVDINECSEGISSCNQICINSVGGYNCDCYFGFALSSDNHTCQGQWYILFSISILLVNNFRYQRVCSK